MTLDELLQALFPDGHSIVRSGNLLHGTGPVAGIGEIVVIGICDGAPLTPADAATLAAHVLDAIEADDRRPILVLVDTEGQEMARKAEMLGLNEYCAHLAKCLLLASQSGHRTIGLEYGKAAAGAFLATALATDALYAVAGAEPVVMDLPSIARVTKLPKQKLEQLAKKTPVFAPGLDPLYATGAVTAVWSAAPDLSENLAQAVALAVKDDNRGLLGRERGGRMLSADVAGRVSAAARTG